MLYKLFLRFAAPSFVLLLLAFSSDTLAEISIQLIDQDGAPLANTTVVLTPLFELDTQVPEDAMVDQIDENFVPRVSVVQRGANVYFPNQDQIRHHVYSFSEAKLFDIPLYSGTPSEPIHFNQSGLVVLGCNIHDQMRGYILVSDSPFFGVSNEQGQVQIEVGISGDYRLSLWHPEQEYEIESTEMHLDSNLNFEGSYQITTAKQFFPRRGSSSGGYF
jgi:plastocyanin